VIAWCFLAVRLEYCRRRRRLAAPFKQFSARRTELSSSSRATPRRCRRAQPNIVILQDLLAKREQWHARRVFTRVLQWDFLQIGSHHREPMIKNDILLKTIVLCGRDLNWSSAESTRTLAVIKLRWLTPSMGSRSG
jgi:hypothetical protein